MIPKIVHYCWFGKKPLPQMALKCIESWRKYLPDYDIIEWNEDNFDVNMIPYTKEAYKAKKFAFVSDYARFWILYKYGGIYFDTDVEVIRPMDDIIARGPFMGCENDAGDMSVASVAPGLGLGVNPGLAFYKMMLEKYATLHFENINGTQNLTTIVEYTTEMLCTYGLQNIKEIQCIENIYVYPVDYFCPISVKDGKLRVTNNTRTIHHFAQSWQSPIRKYARKIVLLMGGETLKNFIKKYIYK